MGNLISVLILFISTHSYGLSPIVQLHPKSLLGPDAIMFCNGSIQVWLESDDIKTHTINLKLSPPLNSTWSFWNNHIIAESNTTTGPIQFVEADEYKITHNTSKIIKLSFISENEIESLSIAFKKFEGCDLDKQNTVGLTLTNPQKFD